MYPASKRVKSDDWKDKQDADQRLYYRDNIVNRDYLCHNNRHMKFLYRPIPSRHQLIYLPLAMQCRIIDVLHCTVDRLQG